MTATTLPSRPDFGAIEARWQAEWKRQGYAHGPGLSSWCPLLDHPSPSECHGGLAPRSHARKHHSGPTDSLSPDARSPHRVDRGIGPCRSIDPSRGPPRLAKQGVELERLPREEILAHIESWRREHEARIREQLRGRGFSLGLESIPLHPRRRAIRTTREVFVTCTGWPHLSRRTDRQLGPQARNRRLGPRSDPLGRRRNSPLRPIPLGRWNRGRDYRRDRTPRDDLWRCGSRREPRPITICRVASGGASSCP